MLLFMGQTLLGAEAEERWDAMLLHPTVSRARASNREESLYVSQTTLHFALSAGLEMVTFISSDYLHLPPESGKY